jgi:hypothetical protein
MITQLFLNTMHIHAYNFALLVRLVLLIIGLVLLFENPRIVVYYIIPAAAALCILPKAWIWWKRQAGVVSKCCRIGVLKGRCEDVVGCC